MPVRAAGGTVVAAPSAMNAGFATATGGGGSERGGGLEPPSPWSVGGGGGSVPPPGGGSAPAPGAGGIDERARGMPGGGGGGVKRPVVAGKGLCDGGVRPSSVDFIAGTPAAGGGLPAAGIGAEEPLGGSSALSKMWVASSSSSQSTSTPGRAPAGGAAGPTASPIGAPIGASAVRPGGGGSGELVGGGVRPSSVRPATSGATPACGAAGGAGRAAGNPGCEDEPPGPFLLRPSKTSRSDPLSFVAMGPVSCTILATSPYHQRRWERQRPSSCRRGGKRVSHQMRDSIADGQPL